MMSDDAAEALLALSLIYLWRNEPEEAVRDDLAFLIEEEVFPLMHSYLN